MAEVKRGDGPGHYVASVMVQRSDLDVGQYGVDVVCTVKDAEQVGFPITINLSRDEAILLCAQLCARLVGMGIGPPV